MRRISMFIMGLVAAGSVWATTNESINTEKIAIEIPGVAPVRTFEKLKQGQPVKIVYLGGSITVGSGASNPSATSYRALVSKWIQETYPQAKVSSICAGVGGTGSDWGAFRLAGDVLQYKPDLVFVEFGVNDEGRTKESIQECMEGIVRQIRKANPATEMVFLYTTTQFFSAPYKKGELPRTIQYQQEIAAHYGIPGINVGYPLWKEITAGGKWETYLPDRTHPSDAGYRIYADCIIGYLKRHMNDKPEVLPVLPSPFTPRPIENPKKVNAAMVIKGEGWNKDESELKKYTALGIASTNAGAEFTFKFNGTFVGLNWVMAPDSGDIEWFVDGGTMARRSSWDKYSEKVSRRNITVLSDNLTPGDHILTVKVSGERNPKSKGTAIRIISFLVE